MYYQQPDGVSVHDGFPNPAADSSLQTLDLNQLLVKHPISTFFMQDSAGGIFIVDRSLTPRHNDLVVWTRDEKLVITPKHRVEENCELWGVVTATITRHRSAA